MAEINKLFIKQYRGINELEIEELNQINLVVGDNNCGKTSVLEALQLFATSGNLAGVYRIARQREVMFGISANSIYENFICMFPQKGSNLEINISGECNEKEILFKLEGIQKKVLIDVKELDRFILREMNEISQELETDMFDGMISFQYGDKRRQEEVSINRFSRVSGTPMLKSDEFNIVYISPFEHLKGNTVGQIIKNDGYKEICLKALQLFDSDIVDMMIFRSDIGNRPVEYLKHRRLGNMPLSVFGDGIKKVLVLSNAIARASGGILLIDEIETAIHKKYYDDIFRFIVKACKVFRVQVFITTHSLEAIDGLLGTQDYEKQNIEDSISVVTLKKEGDSTYSRVLSGREVALNREAFGFEVRL